MDAKQILGVVGIAVILIAVGFAIGLSVGDDDGKDDQGNGGGDDTPGSDYVLEYGLNLIEHPDGFTFELGFTPDMVGEYALYLDGAPLLNGLDQPIRGSFGPDSGHVFVSYRCEYPEGFTFEDVEDSIEVQFSPYIDAVRV